MIAYPELQVEEKDFSLFCLRLGLDIEKITLARFKKL